MRDRRPPSGASAPVVSDDGVTPGRRRTSTSGAVGYPRSREGPLDGGPGTPRATVDAVPGPGGRCRPRAPVGSGRGRAAARSPAPDTGERTVDPVDGVSTSRARGPSSPRDLRRSLPARRGPSNGSRSAVAAVSVDGSPGCPTVRARDCRPTSGGGRPRGRVTPPRRGSTRKQPWVSVPVPLARPRAGGPATAFTRRSRRRSRTGPRTPVARPRAGAGGRSAATRRATRRRPPR